MPNKVRRSVSTAAATPQTAASKVTNTAANKATNTTRATFTQEFNPDYTHIMHDLKQIGIMAASFLVILVALSFFLR